jgi:hypothetical protein
VAPEDVSRTAAKVRAGKKSGAWGKAQAGRKAGRKESGSGSGIRIGITDRALRYRANRQPPPGPRICCLCGATRNVEVGHVNGHEEDTAAANLLWTCRGCNVRCGNTLRRAGIGRLTRQYNPAGAGAENLGA